MSAKLAELREIANYQYHSGLQYAPGRIRIHSLLIRRKAVLSRFRATCAGFWALIAQDALPQTR